MEKEIDQLIAAFEKNAVVRRLFIDEITAIPKWELALKKMADQGKLKDILLITTGSKATDLRRGSERLPGRKGKLSRSNYLFTPISYKAFKHVCKDVLGDQLLLAYLISGGSPIACSELASKQVIPEYVIELVRDWIEGEISQNGRNRSSLINIFSVLYRMGGTPIGQAKLAREAGLANNTVAAGYTEILYDLACVIPAFPWDQNRKIPILRKPCKFHFTNVLTAIAYHPAQVRTVRDFEKLSHHDQTIFYEWLVAQEILRRKALSGEDVLDPLKFWQSDHHEIDFVISDKQFIEVKRGKGSPIEFGWTAHQLPKTRVTVISKNRFQTEKIHGITLEDFLLQHH